MEQVGQFSYILKSGIGMRVWQQAYGSATAYATLRMLLLQMTPGLQMQEHLFLIVYFLTSITIAQLNFSFRCNTDFIYG
jgi:hypothetical protein